MVDPKEKLEVAGAGAAGAEKLNKPPLPAPGDFIPPPVSPPVPGVVVPLPKVKDPEDGAGLDDPKVNPVEEVEGAGAAPNENPPPAPEGAAVGVLLVDAKVNAMSVCHNRCVAIMLRKTVSERVFRCCSYCII